MRPRMNLILFNLFCFSFSLRKKKFIQKILLENFVKMGENVPQLMAIVIDWFILLPIINLIFN